MGALTKCRACGNDVAKTARACPKCGAPRRKGGIIGKAFVLAVFAVGVSMCLVRHQDAERAARNEVASGPAVALSANELMSAYTANEVAADAKYKGKVVAVSGTVTRVGKDIIDKMYVTLATRDPVREVQCMFDDNHAAALARLKNGDKVTIRGRVTGLMGNVGLDDSVLQ
jgi:hypothetical protein